MPSYQTTGGLCWHCPTDGGMCALSNGVVLRQSSMIIESVKYPVLTEKSVRLMDANQYTFDVDLKLTKPQIKALIEELFQVKVTAVNTHRPPKKKRRLGYTQGYKTLYKRVIVSIKPGQSIQFLPTA